MKHSSFLLLGICLLPFGCAPKEEMAADKPLGKRKVSYIRFLNLSSQSSSAKVDSVETYPSVEPESLTGGTVIGQQTQKIEFGSADKPTKGETKPLAGTFLTVVKDNTGTLKFINSGECESFDSGAKVEIANFTSKAVECEFEKKQFKVEPGTSATTATPLWFQLSHTKRHETNRVSNARKGNLDGVLLRNERKGQSSSRPHQRTNENDWRRCVSFGLVRFLLRKPIFSL